MTTTPLQSAIKRVGAFVDERVKSRLDIHGDKIVTITFSGDRDTLYLSTTDLQAMLDAAKEVERLREPDMFWNINEMENCFHSLNEIVDRHADWEGPFTQAEIITVNTATQCDRLFLAVWNPRNEADSGHSVHSTKAEALAACEAIDAAFKALAKGEPS